VLVAPRSSLLLVALAACGGAAASPPPLVLAPNVGIAASLPESSAVGVAPVEVPVGPRRVALRFDLNGRKFPLPLVHGTVAGEPVWMLVDTGANSHVIASWVARKVGLSMHALGDVGSDHTGRAVSAYTVEHPGVTIDDWGALADRKATTILYMPRGTLAEFVRKALAKGMDPATPAVAIASATLPDEAHVAATIAEMGTLVPNLSPGAPVTILIGWALREQLGRAIEASPPVPFRKAAS